MSTTGAGRGGLGGLGRFVPPRADRGKPLPPGLERFLEQQAPPSAGERCEMCNEAIPEEHPHVVNVESRALMCSCRPCYLLFTQRAAAEGKFVSVPDRRLYDADFVLSDAQWEDLQIPVRIAFFFFNSQLGKTVAFYPSPAGATESLLPLDTWEEVMGANPELATIDPDVEALIVYRRHPGGAGGGAGAPTDVAMSRQAKSHEQGESSSYECYLVPIDACYELVGLVRLHWKGFDGGTEAWDAIDSFFADLRERSRRVKDPGLGVSPKGPA